MARASCLMLLLLLDRAAASRTFCTAGRSRPIRIAMIAITTSSSISVNPARRARAARPQPDAVRRAGLKELACVSDAAMERLGGAGKLPHHDRSVPESPQSAEKGKRRTP